MGSEYHIIVGKVSVSSDFTDKWKGTFCFDECKETINENGNAVINGEFNSKRKIKKVEAFLYHLKNEVLKHVECGMQEVVNVVTIDDDDVPLIEVFYLSRLYRERPGDPMNEYRWLRQVFSPVGTRIEIDGH